MKLAHPIPHGYTEAPSEEAAHLLTLQQVSRFLSVCSRTVARLVASGQLSPPVKVGRSSRWFKKDLMTYLQRLENVRQVKGGKAR